MIFARLRKWWRLFRARRRSFSAGGYIPRDGVVHFDNCSRLPAEEVKRYRDLYGGEPGKATINIIVHTHKDPKELRDLIDRELRNQKGN